MPNQGILGLGILRKPKALGNIGAGGGMGLGILDNLGLSRRRSNRDIDLDAERAKVQAMFSPEALKGGSGGSLDELASEARGLRKTAGDVAIAGLQKEIAMLRERVDAIASAIAKVDAKVEGSKKK